MSLPWRSMTAASLATAALRVHQAPQEEHTKLRFLGAFTLTWIALFAVWAVWASLLWPKLFSPLRGLPEPKGNHWLMGQWYKIVAEASGQPMIEWLNTVPHEGLIRYLALFNQERLLVASPKALAEVLVTRNYDFEKPSTIRWSIGRILGIGVLLAEGDDHRFQRKNLMPAFAFRHVKDLYPTFWEKSCEGVEAMTVQVESGISDEREDEKTKKSEKTQATPKDGEAADEQHETQQQKERDGTVVEIGSWGSRITLDIIGVAGLGRDFGAVRDPENPLTVTYQRVFKPSKEAQLLGLLGLLLPGALVNALPVKRNDDVRQASIVIRATCRDLIREKQAKLARKELTDTDILSVALESGAFTEDSLVDQMMTFLAAGHETTASAMTWAIYMLCLNRDVQTRLREEVRARLPSPGRGGWEKGTADVTSRDIDRMPYLSAVCSEVLRYFPPVPLTLRQSAVDTVIDGQHVPKGTRIMLCPWAINKDAALWGPDAARFNPDRWLSSPASTSTSTSTSTPNKPIPGDDTNVKATMSGGASSNYAFMTFLHGPRSCIGQAFARAEMACILATWVGRFEFELANAEEYDEKNLEIKGGITARPEKGLYVRVRVLEGW